VNSDPVPPALLAWLARTEHTPANGWEPEPPESELHCDSKLVTRLASVARPVGGAGRRFVEGCPVIQHPRGRPIAAAAGSAWFVARSALPAGALRPVVTRASFLDPAWVELDPWPGDTAFARTIDLLRAHVARAYEQADAEGGK
jgi:hypothetical protein